MQYLEFIFQSFWHWLGAFLIIAAVAQGVGNLFTTHTCEGKAGDDDQQ